MTDDMQTYDEVFVRASTSADDRRLPLGEVPNRTTHASKARQLMVIGTLSGGPAVRFQARDVMTMRDGRVAEKRAYRKVVE